MIVMKHIRIAVLLCAAATTICKVQAQQSLTPSLYLHNMHYYNVAAGLEDSAVSTSFDAYMKHKFVRTENEDTWQKPATVYLNHLYTWDRKHTASVSYIQDRYSFYSRHILYIGYSHTFDLRRAGKLSAGIRPVINFNSIRPGDIAFIPAFYSRFRMTADLDLGLQYSWKGLTAGVSSKSIFESSVKSDGLDLIKDRRAFYGNLSYDFRWWNGRLSVTPFLLYAAERNRNVDLGLQVGIFNTVSVSYAIRALELRSIYTLRAHIRNRIQAGVALDHSALYTDMNLDVFLSYRF